MWKALLDVVLTWAGRGVRIFRVDNPHTKPVAFWSWLIREAQAVHPDLVFLSEAFTRPAMMATLAKAGFSQSYTYFTWRNTRTELTEYVWQLTIGDLPQFFRPELLHEHARTSSPSTCSTAAARRSRRGSCSQRRSRRATGSTRASRTCEGTPREPGSEEYLDSEKYELKARRPRRRAAAARRPAERDPPRNPGTATPCQRHVPRDRERAADRLREGQWSQYGCRVREPRSEAARRSAWSPSHRAWACRRPSPSPTWWSAARGRGGRAATT